MPSRLSGATRRWLERAAIVTAALATIATSRPRWTVRATALPAPPDPARAAHLIVETNQEIHGEIYQKSAYASMRR